MEKKNRVAVSYAPGNIVVEDMAYPKLMKGGAILRNTLCGICGTDKHTYRGETTQFAGTALEYTIQFPLHQGHEPTCIIEDIDKEGSENLDFYKEPLKVGDRVTFCPVIVCGECFWCRHASWYTWCESKGRGVYGNNGGMIHGNNAPDEIYGSFSRYMTIRPGSYLYKLPDELPDVLGCLVEIMAVTYSLDQCLNTNSFHMDGLPFGGTVVVQGAGPIGLAHMIKARMLGARTVIGVDISDYKLNLAKEFGVDYVINSKKTTEKDRIEFIKEKTRGLGADVVVECTGVASVVPEGLEYLRKCGTYLEPGMFAEVGNSSINMHKVCSKNLRIIGMTEHAVTGYRPSIDMMIKHKNDFPWEKYFTHTYPLDQINEAIQFSMTEECNKVLVDPWA
ncbi:MAG: zinc-dependent alcohol dehydrogenase [Christensenellales bacterium]|jgi:threonine dehydrogenase-like Zn-dependent dehydrogenase